MADADEIVRQELENLGEDAVRLKHAQGQWGTPGSRSYALVSEWLRKGAEARADAKTSEAIALARRANTIAKIATSIAIASIIVTIIIAVVM